VGIIAHIDKGEQVVCFNMTTCIFRIGRNGEYLQIANAEREDEGVYTCLATNKAGSADASVRWVFTGET